MRLKLITGPTAEPITAADIVGRIGVNVGDIASADLDAMIASARRWVEDYTSRALISQTLELALDAFDSEPIELPRSPVSSIVSVKYTDTAGAEQTVGAAGYTLDDYDSVHRLLLAYGAAWPSPRVQPNAVRIRYVAGYGASGAAVPPPIVQAIVLIVGQAYRAQPGRETGLYPAMIPNAAKELLAPFRLLAF